MSRAELNEEVVFDLARRIEDLATRNDYVEQACASNPALQARVNELLKLHDEEASFLESPPEGLPPTVEVDRVSEKPGQTIGRYTLREKIGEGGMGVVYVAEQARPIRRKVALKVIKPGMDSRAVLARFEAEQQALALMNHRNIAKVLDAGLAESGRPYFVMELVKGVPITEYCDKNELSTEQRLKLFTTVCQAVQHAHQKGIIHRDIKPSNVLVTLADGEPVVKVIDFGVAKATNQQLTEKTLYTAFGQMVGTPQYMSPEQAEMSCLDVDTRSDVYSLGVLLYELLTGTTPLEAERLRVAGYAEMQRLIREQEPPKPSTRLSTSGEKLTVIAKHRSVSPEKLKNQVKGDLDWIVMKALEKDRNRRYESPSHLMEDLSNYVHNEPVAARPPTIGYRVTKYVRRNRVAIATTGIVFGLLLSGILFFRYEAQAKQKLFRKVDLELKLRQAAEAKNEDALKEAIADKLAMGDFPEAEKLLGTLEGTEDNELDIAVLHGLLKMLQGDYAGTLKQLESVQGKYSDSVAIEAMTAWVSVQLGDEERYIKGQKKLKDASPTGFQDLLLRGWLFSNYCPEIAFRDFEEAKKLSPTSIMLLLREAEAFRHHAEITVDDELSLKSAEEAISRLRAIEYFLPKTETVFTELAHCYMVASCRARELNDRARMVSYQQAAVDTIARLTSHSIDSQYAQAVYRVMTQDPESLIREYERSKESTEPGDWVIACVAIAYWGEGQDSKAIETLMRTSPSFQAGPGRSVLALASLTDDRRTDGLASFRKSLEQREMFSSPWHIFDWAVLRLFKEETAAAEELEQIVKLGQEAWWEGTMEKAWWLETAKYLQHERDKRSLSRLEQDCRHMRFDYVCSKFAVAVDALANGDKEQAISHLEEGIGEKYIRGFAHWLSLALLKRLKSHSKLTPISQDIGRQQVEHAKTTARRRPPACDRTQVFNT